MMTCTDCVQRLGDQAAGVLSAAQGEELERHLAACADCRREAERFRNSMTALHEAFGDLPVPNLAPAVLARIRAAERPARPWWVPALAGVGLTLALAVPFGLTARPALSDPEVLQAYAEDLNVVASLDVDSSDWTGEDALAVDGYIPDAQLSL